MIPTKDYIWISGIALQRVGNSAVVLVEVNGVWCDVITENIDDDFGHIVKPAGIREVIRKKFDIST